ncbi:hypothetical protein BCR34DRAFT_607844 [Clohesyomyces aquaticus]|uniref:J domain-containing protein n=1 Tax=Clohesyomyces aquaticus TaxID=1231657 RepID=A0A1Y1YCN5_9PLEO|nr:hypothetical protein BCR34DRAFT_607844 [Clohesyomyces aquaticus]
MAMRITDMDFLTEHMVIMVLDFGVVSGAGQPTFRNPFRASFFGSPPYMAPPYGPHPYGAGASHSSYGSGFGRGAESPPSGTPHPPFGSSAGRGSHFSASSGPGASGSPPNKPASKEQVRTCSAGAPPTTQPKPPLGADAKFGRRRSQFSSGYKSESASKPDESKASSSAQDKGCRGGPSSTSRQPFESTPSPNSARGSRDRFGGRGGHGVRGGFGGPGGGSFGKSSGGPSAPADTGSTPDLYKIMGGPRTATTEEIKKAYKILAKRWHPDRKPAEERDAATKK